jgi:hypothetical protein
MLCEVIVKFAFTAFDPEVPNTWENAHFRHPVPRQVPSAYRKGGNQWSGSPNP